MAAGRGPEFEIRHALYELVQRIRGCAGPSVTVTATESLLPPRISFEYCDIKTPDANYLPQHAPSPRSPG